MKKIYKDKGIEIIKEILKKQTMTEPGSLPYLLFGERPSSASLYIKIGRNFEKWFKFIAEDCGFVVLKDGITKNVLRNESKDIDFIILDIKRKIVHYRELKSNLELDTEKLPATYKKVKTITTYLKGIYPEYTIDSSLMTWAVYSSEMVSSKYKNKIKKCSENGVKVTYPIDLFKVLNADISETNYNQFFKEIGKLCS